MPKSSKLLTALAAHKGKDFKQEKQRKEQKFAAKRKAKRAKLGGAEGSGDDAEIQTNGDNPNIDEDESEGWESAEEPVAKPTAKKNASAKAPKSALKAAKSAPVAEDEMVIVPDKASKEEKSEHEDGVPEEAEDDDDYSEDIALSDLALSDEDRADLIPHQRLTINNTAALLAGYKSIALPSSLSFSGNQTITSTTPIEIEDVHDDLTRELAFYKQCLDAATEGRARLTKEGVAFTRPNDYFAEMVKTDEHMGKVKAKLVDEAASKRASADARKQRDLKKFGKQVQHAKLQERDKAKRETLDKINILKRKRKDADVGGTKEEDLFDVALDNEVAGKGEKGDKRAGGRSKEKRTKKDEKFGYGGKKRFSKSGDAVSTGDMGKFSQKKMKGTKPRLGKSRRAKQ